MYLEMKYCGDQEIFNKNSFYTSELNILFSLFKWAYRHS